MSWTSCILIVEDDRTMCAALAAHFGSQHRVLTARTLAQARKRLAEERVDVVILDIRLPDGEAIELISAFRRADAEVVVITAFPKVDAAIRALRDGAVDYLVKPFELEDLEDVVEAALERRAHRRDLRRQREELPEQVGASGLHGDARATIKLRALVRQLGKARRTPVLVVGEQGVGRRRVAAAIHAEQARPRGPFVQLECAGVDADQAGRLLFGRLHLHDEQPGLADLADGGTLYLHGVDELPARAQAVLPQLAASGRFRRVGGTKEHRVEVRLIASTTGDLAEAVREGRFREDLFHRLLVAEVRVAPLRDRVADIKPLAERLLARHAEGLGRRPPRLAKQALRELQGWPWPGNVRELDNTLHAALLACAGDTLDTIGLNLADLPATAVPVELGDELPTLRELQGRYILHVLGATGGNKTAAARILGVSRSTLRDRLATLEADGIQPPAPAKTGANPSD